LVSKDVNKEQEKKTDQIADKCQGKRPDSQSLNSDSAVPMLRFGLSNNFDLFRRKISIACMERYKNSVRLILDEKYFVPPSVDSSLYDLMNDQFEIEKARLKETHKRRDKEINDMRIDRTAMFAYIISKLSKESLDKIQGHAVWSKIEKSCGPLDLWIVIKKMSPDPNYI
jgi:hypothetical protein